MVLGVFDHVATIEITFRVFFLCGSEKHAVQGFSSGPLFEKLTVNSTTFSCSSCDSAVALSLEILFQLTTVVVKSRDFVVRCSKVATSTVNSTVQTVRFHLVSASVSR